MDEKPSEEEESVDIVHFTFTRKCEHYDMTVTMTGDMGNGDMELETINRMALAAKALVYGERGIAAEKAQHEHQHSFPDGELLSSMILERPTPDSLRAAMKQMMDEAEKAMRENGDLHEPQEAGEEEKPSE